MKERLLVTGASGFIGYHLIEEALKNNLDVYAAVRKSSKTNHLSGFNINYTYPDFTSIRSLKDELAQNKYNYIIHAAGVTRARSQQEYNDINAGYTHNLATAALESGAKLKKFVLIGSLAAVGPLNNIDDIIDGHTIPHPVTAYGKSKLKAEDELKAIHDLNYTSLFFSNRSPGELSLILVVWIKNSVFCMSPIWQGQPSTRFIMAVKKRMRCRTDRHMTGTH